MLSQLIAPLLAAGTPAIANAPPSEPEQLAATPTADAAASPDDTVKIVVPVWLFAAQDDATPADSTPATDKDDIAAGNEIVVTGRAPSPDDPVEQINVASFEAVQAVDAAVIAPVTHAYESAIPEPVRDGVHNVLNNLDEPIVFLNFLLQFKIGKAFETLARFTINSTLGIAGLFDVAKREPFHLPRRSNGLADTLGYYGVGPGPYLFLPIIGSTTVRDLVARPFDLLILPAAVPKPFADPKVALGKSTVSAIDERQQNDDKLERIHSAADPYREQREEYLARRRAEIDVLKGKRESIYDPPYYELPELVPEESEAGATQEAPATMPPPAPPAEDPITEDKAADPAPAAALNQALP